MNLAVILILSVHSAGAASEEDKHGAEQKQDHGGEDGPHASTEHGMASARVVGAVDVVLDNTKESEVAGQNDDGHNPGYERSRSGKYGTTEACAKGK
jgi:hypothetical protein